MSGENTEEPQNSVADAVTDAPAIDAGPTVDGIAVGVEAFDVPAPETVATPDAEAAIEDFEVPPPPEFAAAPPPPSPAPAIPSALAENDGADAAGAPRLRKRSTWAPNDTWSSASGHKQDAAAPTAAQKAESRAAASRAATAHDAATRNDVSPAAGGTEGQSYRGWTIAIYGALAVLFFGAIGFMVLQGFSG